MDYAGSVFLQRSTCTVETAYKQERYAEFDQVVVLSMTRRRDKQLDMIVTLFIPRQELITHLKILWYFVFVTN